MEFARGRLAYLFYILVMFELASCNNIHIQGLLLIILEGLGVQEQLKTWLRLIQNVMNICDHKVLSSVDSSARMLP